MRTRRWIVAAGLAGLLVLTASGAFLWWARSPGERAFDRVQIGMNRTDVEKVLTTLPQELLMYKGRVASTVFLWEGTTPSGIRSVRFIDDAATGPPADYLNSRFMTLHRPAKGDLDNRPLIDPATGEEVGREQHWFGRMEDLAILYDTEGKVVEKVLTITRHQRTWFQSVSDFFVTHSPF